jgi:hypothetical protein
MAAKKKTENPKIVVTDKNGNEYNCLLESEIFNSVPNTTVIKVTTQTGEEKKFIRSFLYFKEVIE